MRPFLPRGHARLALLGVVVALGGCEFTAEERQTTQRGYRGTAMEVTYDERAQQAKYEEIVSAIPVALAPAPNFPPGPLPWQNVQVLNDISVAEFNRTMLAMSTWVAGTGNCAYCHNVLRPWDDTLANGTPIYTKLVARRMLQMTRHINSEYASHVANTGVTCYTCHLGKPLPNGLWFYDKQTDYLRHYLDRDGARVISTAIAPSNDNRSSVKQTEWTYALMISQSKSLGVNCTYCHNTRIFSSWEEAPPQRAVAFHGITMLRDLNVNYLAPLQSVYPASRLGPMGDAPKAQCSTCHNGVYKPLFGAQMAKDYPAVWGRPMWNGAPFPGLGMPAAAADPAVPVTTSATSATPSASTSGGSAPR